MYDTKFNLKPPLTRYPNLALIILTLIIPILKVKVKFSHTRYRALGPELIAVYRQSARR